MIKCNLVIERQKMADINVKYIKGYVWGVNDLHVVRAELVRKLEIQERRRKIVETGEEQDVVSTGNIRGLGREAVRSSLPKEGWSQAGYRHSLGRIAKYYSIRLVI